MHPRPDLQKKMIVANFALDAVLKFPISSCPRLVVNVPWMLF